MAANPYDMASDLYGDATDLARSVGSGGTGAALGDAALGLLPGSVTQDATVAESYGPENLSAALYGGMNDYLNPYYDEVIKHAMGDMSSARDQSIQAVGAQADAGGAFGGSRHGLVERGIHEDYMEGVGQMSAGLHGQGFRDAMATSGNLLGQELGRGQFLTGLNAQLDSSQKANNAALEMQLGLARPQTYLAGYGTGMTQDNQTLNVAQLLQSLGGGYFNAGESIADRQTASGAAATQMNQNILSSAQQSFQQYMQDPYKAMDLMAAIFGNDPRNENISQTGTTTQSVTPGLFDWVSLAAQTWAETIPG